MKTIFSFLCIILLLNACSGEKKLLRQAANHVERANYDKALDNYDQILKKDENSFFGNAGKGIVLSEFMGRHEQAIPYLETALKNTPDKTKSILHSNLGKSYHFVGNFERALYYYSKSEKDNHPKWADYDEFLSKRIADCKYAIEHPRVALPENQNLVNLGTSINTPYPEYTPVVTENKIYFTSKRPDSPKEKRNGLDGKYYEAIYAADIQSEGNFGKPARYEIPKSGKSGEAVISASPDGKKLFVFREGKLYESDLNDPTHTLQILDNTINFGYMQNHAALSPDGNTLYFISESERGHGGTDIFMSAKNPDGSWGHPKMLDYTINSEWDEEAPYVNATGTLFFSSNGHPGYGGFDVYKTNFVNGAWTKPENLGQPINSAGDDIYFTLRPNSSKGYYASARPGGFGNLDIYKVHYVTTDLSPCIQDPLLSIDSKRDIDNAMVQLFKLNVPENYKNTIRSIRWQLNGQDLSETGAEFRHTFTKADKYTVQAQIVLYCDTCPNLQARCTSKDILVEAPHILTVVPDQKNAKITTSIAQTKKTQPTSLANSKNKKQHEKNNNSSSDAQITNAAEPVATINETESDKKTAGPSVSEQAELNDEDNFISAEELVHYKWNNEATLFEYNQWKINPTTKQILDQNLSVLKTNPDFVIRILGHADARGTAAYNQQLSLKRAEAVKKYFKQNGVAAKRILSVKGMGETELLNNCSDNSSCPEEQHALNRRVQIQIRATKTNLNVHP